MVKQDQLVVQLCTHTAHALKQSAAAVVISLQTMHVDASATASYAKSTQVNYANLSVSDNGYGIAPEILENIFDP